MNNAITNNAILTVLHSSNTQYFLFYSIADVDILKKIKT